MPKTYTAFREIPGDPLNTKIHQLRNGLTLFLSVNKREPRIFTNIVVRAGSKQDPADTTGLAHYMEHMLFKGTSRIGALDWERESAYLEQISELYEQHRATTDAEARRRIYQQIDELSFEAAKLVAPNEYDRLLGAIGAKDTNAYTSVDQTVYLNDIPANELARWMELESERFRMMALRLFHTELETVYEEFNISQDQDTRKVNKLIREALFPNHPYGTQTTIGTAEHLRNPSQQKIQAFFRTYYVPNNMAIVLSGDFDPEEAVALAERHFGFSKPSRTAFHIRSAAGYRTATVPGSLRAGSPLCGYCLALRGSGYRRPHDADAAAGLAPQLPGRLAGPQSQPTAAGARC